LILFSTYFTINILTISWINSSWTLSSNFHIDCSLSLIGHIFYKPHEIGNAGLLRNSFRNWRILFVEMRSMWPIPQK
jgi:hypothetical protein